MVRLAVMLFVGGSIGARFHTDYRLDGLVARAAETSDNDLAGRTPKVCWPPNLVNWLQTVWVGDIRTYLNPCFIDTVEKQRPYEQLSLPRPINEPAIKSEQAPTLASPCAAASSSAPANSCFINPSK